ncbi:MAG: sodium:solute symporter family protein [Firmicutes bacterium]|nr:sodium:solute symporter family protein [Bacillota bacterium]
MNIYFGGMIVSMIAYLVIGYFVSKKVKSADDYYVAGRRAPVILLSGSLIASYVGTGLYTGDAAWAYEGAFTIEAVGSIITIIGYILGVVLFGRYLRRLGVVTIPELFGKRFHSQAIEKLASAICIITMGVYSISVSQGIGALMHGVTGLDQNLCMLIAMLVFTFVAVVSGSNGVLITDTIMSLIFIAMTIIGCICIARAGGGWWTAIETITKNPETAGFFRVGGPEGIHYGTAGKNMFWAFWTAIIWFGVCSVSPWQTSRYLMAKSENAAIRAAVPAMLGVGSMHFIIVIAGALTKAVKPDLEDPSQVLIWAAMNVMPTIVGVLMLTGVLAAGISSATTFLSQIGTNVARDFAGEKTKHPILVGRVAMLVTAALVVIYNLTNPPSIFWILMLGGAIVSSAFLPTGMAAIYSKRLTKQAAFAGMLCGFLASFGVKLYTSVTGASFPVWADSNVIGLICNVIVMIVVSAFTQVTAEERASRESLFIMPESEKDPAEVRKTMKWVKASLCVGTVVAVFMILLWAAPYMKAVG